MCWSASSVHVYFPCVHRGQSPLVLPSLSYIRPFLSVPHWCCRSCSWGPSWRLLLTDSSAGARWSRPRCPAPGLKAPCRSPPGWRPGRGGTPDCRWRLHPACKWGIGCWWCRAPGASACRSRHLWSPLAPGPGWRSGRLCTCSRSLQSTGWCRGWRARQHQPQSGGGRRGSPAEACPCWTLCCSWRKCPPTCHWWVSRGCRCCLSLTAASGSPAHPCSLEKREEGFLWTKSKHENIKHSYPENGNVVTWWSNEAIATTSMAEDWKARSQSPPKGLRLSWHHLVSAWVREAALNLHLYQNIINGKALCFTSPYLVGLELFTWP